MGNELSRLSGNAVESSRGQQRQLPDGADIQLVPWLDAHTSALVRAIVASVARKHSDVLAVTLFGSIARHDERSLADREPSDVDLMLLVEPSLAHGRISLEQEMAITETILEAGDPYGFTPREVKTLLVRRDLAGWDPLFIENVARDGILLWARGPLPPQLAAIAERTPPPHSHVVSVNNVTE